MAFENSVSQVITLVRALIHDQIQIDGRDSEVYDNDSSFTLSEPFVDSSSIKVFQNGTELASQDFSYDSNTNEVTIDFQTSGLALSSGDIIVITYSYYAKWSDTEITNAIKSIFSYFVKHRYSKVFDISSDNKIVTINGVNPEPKEIYFIALITSIHLDPQNIDIRVQNDFQISKNRDKSDAEQIKDAFFHFNRFVGTITYNFLEEVDFT